jgi:hypothetical protein
MQMKFGVLADYAGQGASAKTILVGIFDTIYNVLGALPIGTPPFYVFASIEAHITEGTDHTAIIHFTTADGADLPTPIRVEVPFKFMPRGRGRMMLGNLAMSVPQGVALPGLGSYEFNILIDGRHVGSIPLYVEDPPLPTLK